MDEDRKKVFMIVVVVVCIALAAGIIYWTNFRGKIKSSPTSDPIFLKCTNKTCGKVTEMSAKEFREKMQEMGPGAEMMMPGMGPMAFKCPHCGKKTAMMAQKCPKCGEVFIPNYRNPKDYPDKCPKCGYSAIEEMQKKRHKSK